MDKEWKKKLKQTLLREEKIDKEEKDLNIALEIIQRKMNIVRMKRKAVNEYRDELILNYYSKKIRVCS